MKLFVFVFAVSSIILATGEETYAQGIKRLSERTNDAIQNYPVYRLGRDKKAKIREALRNLRRVLKKAGVMSRGGDGSITPELFGCKISGSSAVGMGWTRLGRNSFDTRTVQTFRGGSLRRALTKCYDWMADMNDRIRRPENVESCYCSGGSSSALRVKYIGDNNTHDLVGPKFWGDGAADEHNRCMQYSRKISWCSN